VSTCDCVRPSVVPSGRAVNPVQRGRHHTLRNSNLAKSGPGRMGQVPVPCMLTGPYLRDFASRRYRRAFGRAKRSRLRRVHIHARNPRRRRSPRTPEAPPGRAVEAPGDRAGDARFRAERRFGRGLEGGFCRNAGGARQGGGAPLSPTQRPGETAGRTGDASSGRRSGSRWRPAASDVTQGACTTSCTITDTSHGVDPRS